MANEDNTLFPGRPDYVGPKTGMFALLHHEILCEESHNVMERVAYVKKYKSANEVDTRLHNMLRLGGCDAVYKLATLDAADDAKCAALYADYDAKRAPLYAAIFAYIKLHIPDCAWDGSILIFPKE